MSKIIKLAAENIKRLRCVEIAPDPAGNMVVIGGENGQGKSSVLDSIAMALGGGKKIPQRPIRDGESKGRILLETSDLIVERTFTAAGGTSLTVRGKDGVKLTSPQAVLDRLTAQVAFDPMEFCRMDPREQAAMLRELSGVDASALDAERKAAYEERTLVNREVERANALAESLPFHADAPKAEVDAQEVLDELNVARSHNAKADELERAERNAGEEFQERNRKVKQTLEEIEVVKRQLAELDALYDEQVKWRDYAESALSDATLAVGEFELIDEQPIADRLASLAETNRRVAENRAVLDAKELVTAKRMESDKLTVRIEDIDREKHNALLASKLPIKGLAFSADSVTYRGVPLEQASQAERIRVSMAIALAANLDFPVCLIRDGSLLDEGSLALVAKMATDAGAQVWIERVGEGEECQVIIEDGGVKGVA